VFKQHVPVIKKKGHRTRTGTRPTPLATTTAFFLGQSLSAALLVLLQYNTTLPKHTLQPLSTQATPLKLQIYRDNVRFDPWPSNRISHHVATQPDDKSDTKPNPQNNCSIFISCRILRLHKHPCYWDYLDLLLLLDSEARVRQLQIAAKEKNNADRPRTLAKLLFFLSLTASPTKKTDWLPSIWSSSPLLFPTSTFSTSFLTGSSFSCPYVLFPSSV
jgi:hypothetical protein